MNEVEIEQNESSVTFESEYLELDILDMPRTHYRASEGERLNNPPCPITPTLTSSSVHHSSHQLTTTFFILYNVT